MPISSTEIQNILSAQVGMFASSAQYAQAVSNQYGYQPGGGGGVDDPRNSPALMGGMMASGAVRGLDVAAQVGGTAAMFGMAPRVLDPFTGVAGAAAAGYRGAGVAGMLGVGAAAAGAYMALGSVFKWGADQAVAGAQQQAMLNYQMGQMAPRLGMSQLGAMSSMVSGAARMGMGSLQDITSMMQAGASDGSINTQSLTQFQQSFQKLLGNVRQVASALSTSLTEAQQAMQQVKSIGVGSDQAANFLGSMRMIGQGAGLNPQQMYGIAAQGAAFGRQMGINPQNAAMGAMINQGVLGMVEKGGLIEGVGTDSYGRFNQGAMRFLGSAPGQRVLAAMMTEGGQLDPGVAAQVAAGTLSRQEIQRMASQNLGRRGMRDVFNARSGELAGEFISQYGPQAIAPSVQAMTSGGLYGSNPESMRTMLTGLTRAELGQMNDLNRFMPAFRSRLMEAGREGFQEGVRRPTFGEALDAQIGQLVAPFKDRLRQYGADLSQSVQQSIENVTRDFMGSPPRQANPATYAQYIKSYIATGNARNPIYQTMQRHGGGMGGDFMAPSIPEAQSFMGGLPSGLRLGSMAPGVGFGDLPGFGLGTESYNPYITGLTAATNIGIGGRSLMYRAGQGVGAFGTGLMEATAVGGTGFMGLGGYGLATGSGRLAGLGLRGAGLAMRGLGYAGLAVGAYDVATNVGPAVSRAFGMSPITEGAVMGENAALLQYMSQNNMLGGEQLTERGVGMFGLSGGNTGDLTPVGGLTSMGRQNFATPAFRAAFNEFVQSGGPRIMGDFSQQYGDRGSQALRIATLSSGQIDTQARVLAKETGMSLTQARQVMAAAGASGLRAAYTFDAAKERKALLSGGFKISSGPVSGSSTNATGYTASQLSDNDFAQGHNLALDAMDETVAGKSGQVTLDKFLYKMLHGDKVNPNSPTARERLAAYFDKLSSSQGSSTPALNMYTAEQVLKGEIGPKGKGSSYMELPSREIAADMLQYNDQIGQRLERERADARATGRLAANVGMFTPSIMQDYVSGFTTSDPAQRTEAMETMFTRLAKSGTVTAKGLVSAAAIAGRDPSEAMQRFAPGAEHVARYRSMMKRKVGTRGLIEGMVGADFSSIDRSLLDQNFRNIKTMTKFDAPVEAAITAKFEDMQRAKLGEGEAVDHQAATNMSDQLFRALKEAAKGNTNKLEAMEGKIATFMGQSAGKGGVKGVEGVMANLGRFSDAVENATRKLESMAGNQSTP